MTRPRIIALAAGMAVIGVACGTSEDGAETGAGDDGVSDGSLIEVEQVASTSREDVLSALRGDREDDAFPDSLVDTNEIFSGGPPPDGFPPSTSRASLQQATWTSSKTGSR